MRIVAVADTHLFHHELLVPEGDVFVHASDMCRGGDLAELAEAAAYNATTWECERPPSVIDLDPDTLEISLVAIPRRA